MVALCADGLAYLCVCDCPHSILNIAGHIILLPLKLLYLSFSQRLYPSYLLDCLCFSSYVNAWLCLQGAGDKAKDTANSAKGAVKDAAGSVKDAAGQAKDKAGSAASKA